MTRDELADAYLSYIDCLNKQDWQNLEKYVSPSVSHNGRPMGIYGYRRMLEGDFEAIPDLRFNVDLLMADPPFVAARLGFDCTPKSSFLGLPVNGKKIAFPEHVFYEYAADKIVRVWSVIDKAEVEKQVR